MELNILNETLVLLVERERNLLHKADELSADFETAQNCKNAEAIDEIAEAYNELEEELENVHESEKIVLVSILDQLTIDFYQN